ncbi:MAG: hypothetical protein O2904_00610 [bacterium]|nr:hypothetical protein [bacterium]
MTTIFPRVKHLAVLSLSGLLITILQPSISSFTVETAHAASNECADGIDNDFDGFIDYPQDTQCLSLHDESEGPTGRGVFLRINDGLEVVESSGHITYTIGVRTEREDTRNVDVHFFVPHQTNLIDASNAGRKVGDYVVWRNVTVYPGTERKLYVNVSVTPHAIEDLLIVAEATSEGEKAIDTTRVKESSLNKSRLRITVSDNKKFAEPNERLNYTIRVENPNGPAQKFRLRSELSTYLVFNSASHQPQRNHRVLEWVEQEIGHNEYREYTIVADVERETPDNFPLQLTASIADGHAKDTTQVYTGVLDSAFSVTVSDGVDQATPGDLLTYAINIQNRTNKLATEVDVNNALPSFTEYVDSSEGGQWTGKNVRWEGMTVSPHGQRTLFVTARVRSDATYGAKLRNSVEIRGQTAVDNTGISTSRVGKGNAQQVAKNTSPLTLRKIADRSEVQPGDNVRYTIYMRNNSNRAFNNIEVQDRMNRAYMEVLGSEYGQIQGDTLRWTIPVLAPGEEWSVEYTARVASFVPHGIELNNVVSVSGDGMETVSLNERVMTSSMNVIRNLPPTGVGFGGIFVSITGLIGALQTIAQRRKLLI